MEPIFMYLLQSIVISGGFLAVYHIFLKRETLFKENRLFLLTGLVLAFLFPLIKIKRNILVDRPIFIETGEQLSQVAQTASENVWHSPENILLTLYIGVCLFLMARFILKLASLKKLAQNAYRRRERPFLHMQTEKRISPFSFFNYIFYNPSLFEPNELHSVLEHEKVHARQLHTLDILLLEVLKIFFWFNPALWFYKSAVKQNLEYLADHFAIANAGDKKSYQYLMLKQAVDTQEYTLANSFYNSLIKKRIVMLNQNQSKKINVLKTLMIAPLLGLLLVSFNIEENFLYKDLDSIDSVIDNETAPKDKTVELKIDKNTTDTELDKIKKDLAKDGIDFSYTTVRNDNKEIIDISLQMSGKNSKGKTFSGNYSSNSNDAIDPITVLFDDESNAVSFWNARKKNVKIHKIKGTGTISTGDSTKIIIRKRDDKKIVIVDGEQLSDEEVKELHIGSNSSLHVIDEGSDLENKHVTIRKVEKKGKGNHVMVIRDSDDDEDIEVISGDDDSSFFFIDNDGKGEPLYYVDGKKAKSEDIKKIDPKDIDHMNVLKGDKAIEKYGKKAKNGVIEITTKKSK